MTISWPARSGSAIHTLFGVHPRVVDRKLKFSILYALCIRFWCYVRENRQTIWHEMYCSCWILWCISRLQPGRHCTSCHRLEPERCLYFHSEKYSVPPKHWLEIHTSPFHDDYKNSWSNNLTLYTRLSCEFGAIYAGSKHLIGNLPFIMKSWLHC